MKETGVEQMTTAIAELTRVIDDMSAADGIASAPVMLDDLQALRRQIDRLEAVFTRRVAAAHMAGAASGEGFVTTAAFLRHGCHLSAGAARSRVDIAMQLVERPSVADSFAAGAISYLHVKTIVDALNPLPPQLQADAEPVLLETARRHDPSRVAQVARRLRHIVDPDGQAGIDERHYEQRWFEIPTTFQGLGMPRGLLDPESAAIVRTAIDALSTPAGDFDSRTPAQRRADALVEIARRVLDSADLPESGGERPHLCVNVDYATLKGESTVPAELNFCGPIGIDAVRRISCDAMVTRVVTRDPADTPDALAGTRDALAGTRDALADTRDALAGTRDALPDTPDGLAGTPDSDAVRARPTTHRSTDTATHSMTAVSLLPATALALPKGIAAAIGAAPPGAWPVDLPPGYLDALPPQLRGPTQVLDVGRTSRTATSAIRKALAARDKGCVMPGCDRPPSRCEAHHVIHWADGGVTAIHNMVLLCGFHHRFVHEYKWQIRVRPDGTVTVTPPPARAA